MEDPIVVRKRSMRKHLLEQRAGLGETERERMDWDIAQAVLGTVWWQSAQTVYTYLSFGSEVDTRRLIREAWDAQKTVALPWCVPHTRDIRWFVVDTFDGLVRSKLGIEEPVPDPAREVGAAADARSLALVPALTFDRAGYRLGYGGGFYDGFLAGFGGTSVGLCRDGFLIDDLDALGLLESHDRPVDAIVTNIYVVIRRKPVR